MVNVKAKLRRRTALPISVSCPRGRSLKLTAFDGSRKSTGPAHALARAAISLSSNVVALVELRPNAGFSGPGAAGRALGIFRGALLEEVGMFDAIQNLNQP